MPRLPKDYQKGLIYKLCCNDITIKDIYVGSTTDFTTRKYLHKSNCNNPNSKGYNYKVYQFIRDNGDWSNWSMVLVEKYPCENALELAKRERYFQETLESKLNCYIPSRTKKEYYVENIDKMKEKNKLYRIENSDKIKEYQLEYRVENIDKIKEYQLEYRVENIDKIKEYQVEYRIENVDKIKEKKKEYYVDNVDKIKEKQKVYRDENKDKIKKRRTEKITCECGSVVNKYGLIKHCKSKKHLKLMNLKK